MNYVSFCKSRDKIPPYYQNTRVYSNMLITTNAKLSDGRKLRNELFFNDDTDLCLRVMKDGLPIIQINAFLIDKGTTMVTKGGMTDFYNDTDDRMEFAKELKDAHHDVVRIVRKFGRWHHQVNYKKFKRNKLIRVDNYNEIVGSGVNDYGMVLVDKTHYNKS